MCVFLDVEYVGGFISDLAGLSLSAILAVCVVISVKTQFSDPLKRISVRYSGDAYSFHCGMHAIVTME